MSYPFERGLGYPQSVHVETLGDLTEEVVRAREKFPRGNDLGLALLEEVQELFEELDASNGKVTPRTREEAIQVACVALRLAEEGDPTWTGDAVTESILLEAQEVGALAREHLHRKYPKVGGDVAV